MFHYYETKYAGTDYKVILGLEKPRLIYRNNHWYHRNLNICFNYMMGNEKVIPFFMEPLIAIKQAHLCKRGVKRYIADKKLPLYDNDWAEAKFDKDAIGYRDWCNATGRHDELHIGVSKAQKEKNEAADTSTFNIHGKWRELDVTKEAKLAHYLNDGSVAASNYVKGFINLNSEFGFVDWIRDNGWLRGGDTELRKLRMVWSKEYDIGI